MIQVLMLLCLFVYSQQKSTPQDATYIAAVVEYNVNQDTAFNIRHYLELIHNATEQNADIVVFPEMTLTRGRRAVPVPIYGLLKTNPIPALNSNLYDEILVSMSTAARQHEIYVVINIQEEMNCTEPQAQDEYCPEAKYYLFNTNVVFDRTGAVIDRYRKINLFGEATRTPALRPELGIFTTDFGVTFGHFICFDLMFQVPAIQNVEKYNLTDIIMTTMWFSEMPYLTAVEIQEAYGYALNVNFITAGANNPSVGSGGTGIYSGKAGALVSTFPGVPTTRLLVSKVPKVPGQVDFPVPGPIYDDPTDHDGLVLIRDPSIPSHVTRKLVPGFQEFTLVDKEVSCRFRIRMNQRGGQQSHVYRAIVFDGSNKHLRHYVGVASCSIIACKTEDITSCPYKFDRRDNSYEIEELSIQVTTYRQQYNNTLKCSNIVYFPVSLQSNRFPLESKDYAYSDQNGGLQQDGRAHLKIELNHSQNSIIAFGIYGRLYYKDVVQQQIVTEKDIQAYREFEDRIFSSRNEKLADESNKL